MGLLYNYETYSKNTCQKSVCDMWNLAYNLEEGQIKYAVPGTRGSGILTSACINRNIQMINYDVNFCVPVEMTGESRNPHMDLLFCLGESISWELPEHKKNFEITTGESYIGISKGKKKKCIFPAKQNINILEIKIPLLTFRRMLDEGCIECSLDCFDSDQIPGRTYQLSTSIQVILHQLLNCTYNSGLRELYIEAKILELLAVYFSETVIQTDRLTASSVLSADDIKCIHSAKEILDNNLTDSPTIQHLSKLVNLNEYKLKKGFKELFSIPVHTYVIQRKLEFAKLLMDSKRISVSEAAYRAGYGNVSHFASAFRKQYGVNPGNYVKAMKDKIYF